VHVVWSSVFDTVPVSSPSLVGRPQLLQFSNFRIRRYNSILTRYQRSQLHNTRRAITRTASLFYLHQNLINNTYPASSCLYILKVRLRQLSHGPLQLQPTCTQFLRDSNITSAVASPLISPSYSLASMKSTNTCTSYVGATLKHHRCGQELYLPHNRATRRVQGFIEAGNHAHEYRGIGSLGNQEHRL
jgi:hypothetical protein